MSMKKTVLKFGLLSAALSSAMMLATVPFIHRLGFEKGAIFGYTAIVLSFLLVFFGLLLVLCGGADGGNGNRGAEQQ